MTRIEKVLFTIAIVALFASIMAKPTTAPDCEATKEDTFNPQGIEGQAAFKKITNGSLP